MGTGCHISLFVNYGSNTVISESLSRIIIEVYFLMVPLGGVNSKLRLENNLFMRIIYINTAALHFENQEIY